MIVREHKRSEDGEFCRFCGANYIGGTFGTEATCLAREETHESYEIRPEPARREFASEAFDEIGKRLAELKEERSAAMNHTEPEETAGLNPEYDYGCG